MTPHTPLRHNGRETTADTYFRSADGVPVKETWQFARWTITVSDDFARWAATVLPHPLQVATNHLDALILKDAEISRKLELADHDEQIRVKEHNQKENEAAQKEGRKPKLQPFLPQAKGYSRTSDFLMERATEKMCCYLGENSPEIQSLLKSRAGSAYLFMLLLKPAHPDMTQELAGEIIQQLGQDDVKRILETVQGTLTEEVASKKSLAPAASK